MKLVWSDEFTTPGVPDPTKWKYETGGGGWGTGNLEYDTTSHANSFVDANGLNLTALHQQMGTNQYTSAKLNSLQTFTYGRFDAMVRQPHGVGIGEAFWMMPAKPEAYGVWPHSGEIDIMESVGWNPGVDYGTPHMAGTHAGGKTTVPTYDTAFHLYSVNWTPQQIQWFADGVNYYTYTPTNIADSGLWPFNKPFYIILSLGVGGQFGGAKGVDPTIFPQTLQFKYVRVYQ